MVTPRLLLVEDDALYRETVAEALRVAGHEVLEASTAAEALAVRGPLVGALVDLRLSRGSGFEVLTQLRARAPGAMLAALTAHSTDEDVFGAIAAGADGYLLKSDAIDELPAHVGALLKGLSPLSPGIARRLMAHFAQRPRLPPDAKLSAREQELLEVLAGGFTFQECASSMGISVETVKTLVKRIRDKFHAGSVTEAISVGFRAGLLK